MKTSRPQPTDEFVDQALPSFREHWVYKEFQAALARPGAMSVHEISVATDLHFNTVSRLFKGLTDNPSFFVVERIACVLGMELELIDLKQEGMLDEASSS